MHERYFFAADVLSVLYAFCVPGGWRVMALVQFASAFSYLPFLFRHEAVPLALLPFAMLAALALVVRRAIQDSGVFRDNNPTAEAHSGEGGLLCNR